MEDSEIIMTDFVEIAHNSAVDHMAGVVGLDDYGALHRKIAYSDLSHSRRGKQSCQFDRGR